MAKLKAQQDEVFREALSAATKALSATDEIEVSFSPDGTAQTGK